MLTFSFCIISRRPAQPGAWRRSEELSLVALTEAAGRLQGRGLWLWRASQETDQEEQYTCISAPPSRYFWIPSHLTPSSPLGQACWSDLWLDPSFYPRGSPWAISRYTVIKVSLSVAANTGSCRVGWGEVGVGWSELGEGQTGWKCAFFSSSP